MGTEPGKDATAFNQIAPDTSVEKHEKGKEEEDKEDDTPPASCCSLFRFATGKDLALISVGMTLQVVVGCGFAAMNLVFGELLDDLSAPTGSILESISSSINLMLILAGVMGVAAFIAMSSIPYAAAGITNNVRIEYMKSVLRQDMAFFDGAKPGRHYYVFFSSVLEQTHP